MRGAGALLGGFVAIVVGVVSASESPTTLAQEHVRKACELVWAKAAPHQIDRCTERAMAALGEDERLRYAELTRMLIASDLELESCKAELVELQRSFTGTDEDSNTR